ncbi:MAG: DUF6152 family protein [Acidobacteria bacterium]|nr:DUF6152 family protein [Acidobacteriota bacterium]
MCEMLIITEGFFQNLEAKQMRRNIAIVLAGVVMALATVPVVAHHAFSAEFDANRPIHLEGKVVKMEWINPHAWVHLEIADGTVWMVEGGTPNTLLRRGFDKNSLLPGTEIIVDGYQAKDGSNKGNGRDLTFKDGRKLFMGSSGTGAPTDGRDATEPE